MRGPSRPGSSRCARTARSFSTGQSIGWADVNDDEILRGIKTGLDAGVNHWDNADIYGNGRAERTLADYRHVSEGLADPSRGKRVTVRDGRTMTRDGPFAEVKGHLAGFYLVECETMERAIEHAAKAPDAAYGGVEVRPVLDLRAMDM